MVVIRTILIALILPIYLNAQQLPLNQEYSNSRWATNEKALRGLEGSIDKVEIEHETDSSIMLHIHYQGYDRAILKVNALTGSGNRSTKIFASSDKLNGRSPVAANLIYRQQVSTESESLSTPRIEIVLTNGVFRNKGHSYVYDYAKTWTKKIENRPAQTVNIVIRPIGKARDEFLR